MKVTVCIPQYNRSEALKLVIQDLLSQTYQDFELLIVDDASTDNTLEIIQMFTDSRIHYFRNEKNLGLYPNFNRCLDLAKSEYVAIYHNHDRYEPDIIEKSVQMLDQFPQIGFVHTGTVMRNPHNNYDQYYIRKWKPVSTGKSFIHTLIRRWDSPIHQPTVMARREMYERVGYYEDDLYDACADSAIWMKMCMLADVGYVPLPLMRITPRISTDRYGQFQWSAVLGMARAHRLGVDLFFGKENSISRKQALIKLQLRHDTYFLILLSQWIAKLKTDLVQQGLSTIHEECSHPAYLTAIGMSKTTKILNPLWIIAARFYRRIIFNKIRSESLNGQKRINKK